MAGLEEVSMVPTFEDIMNQRPEIMSFKLLKKKCTYAVVGYRYVNLSTNGQVLVAKLMSAEHFDYSADFTQEVWAVKVLKDLLVGDLKRQLPFWVGLDNEKQLNNGSYYPMKPMDFSEEQLDYFPWARSVREDQSRDVDMDDSVSTVHSAVSNTSYSHPQFHNSSKRIKFCEYVYVYVYAQLDVYFNVKKPNQTNKNNNYFSFMCVLQLISDEEDNHDTHDTLTATPNAAAAAEDEMEIGSTTPQKRSLDSPSASPPAKRQH